MEIKNSTIKRSRVYSTDKVIILMIKRLCRDNENKTNYAQWLNKQYAIISPSIHFLYRQSVGRVAGGLEPIPAIIGRKAGYTLDRSPVHHRAT